MRAPMIEIARHMGVPHANRKAMLPTPGAFAESERCLRTLT